MLWLYRFAIFLLILYVFFFVLQWIIKKQIRILLFIPSITFLIISLVFVGLIAYNYLSGNYAACQADPLCMDEATGFWAWAAFMAFAISAVLAVFAFALNGFLRRFQHANLR